LRQKEPLTKEDQDNYFNIVVSNLFDQEHPDQILFSYLENDVCIGYGGLVHINWTDRNAEISFIMDTELERDYFEFHWKTYLNLIEQVAFEELHLQKIFTYAFDMRPKLYEALEQSGYKREARLKEHCFFDGKFIDVIIHSKIKEEFTLRKATMDDVEITFQWANHPQTREFAFQKEFISFDSHAEWFKGKLADNTCIFKLFIKGDTPIGSIRFDVKDGEGLISYLTFKKSHRNSILSLER
jgi:RimJ/RimL family protein N-acetyltransferase